MKKLDEIKTNQAGFVAFANRSYGYRGDKETWARVSLSDTGEIIKLTVRRASKGMISDGYETEIREFCSEFGIDWDSVGCGDSQSIDF